MSATVFPVSLYEDILPKLVAVLELTQDPAGVSNLQARQKLLQAVRLQAFCLFKFTHSNLFALPSDKQLQKCDRAGEGIRDQPPWWRAAH